MSHLDTHQAHRAMHPEQDSVLGAYVRTTALPRLDQGLLQLWQADEIHGVAVLLSATPGLPPGARALVAELTGHAERLYLALVEMEAAYLELEEVATLARTGNAMPGTDR